MTKSENNTTQSENSCLNVGDGYLNSLDRGAIIYSTMLSGSQKTRFTSPICGYLNLFLLHKSSHCTLQIQEHSYVLHERENILIQMGKGASFELESYGSDNRVIVMFFDCDGFPRFENENIAQAIRAKHGLFTQYENRISLALTQIADLYAEKSCLNQLKIQMLLAEVIIHQIEGLAAENNMEKLNQGKNHFELAQLAKQLIDEDLSKNHTISDLAKAVGTNTQYLKKYFKQQYGKTVMNYMMEVKMEHAKMLILQNKYRITDVARMSGYKHPTHFSTAFKKYFGIVPNSLKYALLLCMEWPLGVLDFIGYSTNL